MKKILERWYVSLVLLPLVINYFTDFFKIPNVFSRTDLWLLFLFIVVFIGCMEYYKLFSELKRLKYVPKGSDKKIIKELLEKLDVKLFEEEISEKNSWYGYDRDAFFKTLDFKRDSKLISNKTSDKYLNQLINELCDALGIFHEYCSDKLFGSKMGRNELEFAKEHTERYEAAKTQSVEMNKLTSIAHARLENLLDYLRAFNYLEETEQ